MRGAGKKKAGDGIEARCPWIVAQMRNFIVNAKGRAEAAGGKHDDDIMALAIGVQLLGFATPWREVQRAAWLPPDLRGLETGRKRGGGGTFS